MGRPLGSNTRKARTLLAVPFVAALLLAICGSPGVASDPPSNTVVYRFGVVGNRGKIAQLERSRPTVVAGIKGLIVQIATSNSDGYALGSNGTVWAWGVNSYGELGDGQLTPYETKAVKVDFPVGVKITALANPMPFDAGLAIDSNGHAWGWGLNGNDDLCLSALIETRPQQLPLSDVTLVTGARTHALFDSNGLLYACGSGDAGELGNGSTTSTSIPNRRHRVPERNQGHRSHLIVGGIRRAARQRRLLRLGLQRGGPARHRHHRQQRNARQGRPSRPGHPRVPRRQWAEEWTDRRLLKNGSVWTWGSNDRGQLGIGTRTNSDIPVQVHVPRRVTLVEVNSGGYASYGIDNTGRLWAWGDNSNGQLGTGLGNRNETTPR